MGDLLKNLVGRETAMEGPMKRVEPGVVTETLAAGIMDQSPFAEEGVTPAGPIPFRAGPFNPFAERFDEVVKLEGVEEEQKGWSVNLDLSDAGAVLEGVGLKGGKMDVKRVAEGVVVRAKFHF